MTAGEIVLADWRDAIPSTGEPNKRRPGVVVGSARIYRSGFPFALVVPLTGEAALAIPGASATIAPSRLNGCTKMTYALAWNVQCVPLARVMKTTSRLDATDLVELQAALRECVIDDDAREAAV